MLKEALDANKCPFNISLQEITYVVSDCMSKRYACRL